MLPSLVNYTKYISTTTKAMQKKLLFEMLNVELLPLRPGIHLYPPDYSLDPP